jgi:hypothetical protein
MTNETLMNNVASSIMSAITERLLGDASFIEKIGATVANNLAGATADALDLTKKVNDAVSEAISALDFDDDIGEQVEKALDEADIDGKVENAVNEIDVEEMIGDYFRNNSINVENLEDFEEEVKNIIRNSVSVKTELVCN